MKILGILMLLGVALSKPLNPKKVLYAINCGAPSSYKGPNGITYEKDVQPEAETIVADYNLNRDVASQVIKYTRESDIYMTERHAYKTFSYRVPLQKEGTYVLILKFAEMYFTEKGKRVFNVKFGQRRVVEDLDVVARVGKFAAYDEYIEFEYLAKQIFFRGSPCLDAIVNGNLIVSLEKTEKDNPFIHGIVLYAGNLNETDIEDQQHLRENWESIHREEKKRKETERLRKQEAKQRRKERVKVRNDHLNELEDDDFDTDSSNTNTIPRISIKDLIVSPVGVAALWVAFGIGLLTLKGIFNKIVSIDVSYLEKVREPVVVQQQQQKQVKQAQPSQAGKTKAKKS